MNYLNQTARLYRSSKKPSSNPYTIMSDNFLIELPCRIARGSAKAMPGQPHSVLTGSMRAYLDASADILPGDRLECEGKNYTVSFVYKPGGHHTEADIEFTGADV